MCCDGIKIQKNYDRLKMLIVYFIVNCCDVGVQCWLRFGFKISALGPIQKIWSEPFFGFTNHPHRVGPRVRGVVSVQISIVSGVDRGQVDVHGGRNEHGKDSFITTGLVISILALNLSVRQINMSLI